MGAPASFRGSVHGAAQGLTSRIARARHPEEVLALVRRHLRVFDHIHTTTCLYMLAKLRGLRRADYAAAPAFGGLVRQHCRHLDGGALDGRQLANTLWAVAACPQAPGAAELLRRACPQVARRAEGLGHRDLANSLWALAVLGEAGPAAALPAGAALARPAGFRPQELCCVVWALATCALGGAAGRLGPLAACAAARGPELEPQHLALVAWAMAPAEVSDARALGALAGEAARRRGDLGPQELANPVWALSRASAAAAEARALRGLARSASGRLPEFKHQELANTAWAFAEAFRGAGGGARPPGVYEPAT